MKLRGVTWCFMGALLPKPSLGFARMVRCAEGAPAVVQAPTRSEVTALVEDLLHVRVSLEHHFASAAPPAALTLYVVDLPAPSTPTDVTATSIPRARLVALAAAPRAARACASSLPTPRPGAERHVAVLRATPAGGPVSLRARYAVELPDGTGAPPQFELPTGEVGAAGASASATVRFGGRLLPGDPAISARATPPTREASQIVLRSLPGENLATQPDLRVRWRVPGLFESMSNAPVDPGPIPGEPTTEDPTGSAPRPVRRRPGVYAREPHIEGSSYPVRDVQRGVARGARARQRCYTAAWYATPGLLGSTTVHFMIDDGGVVVAVSVPRSSTGSFSYAECLAASVWPLRFRASGESVSVTQTFDTQ